MTTVNTFDDLLDILDRNPDYREALRQRVLDEEFARLPERIDRAVKSVDDLAQTVADFVRRTDDTLAKHDARLELAEGQIAALNAATNRVLETVADIQTRLANVEAKVDVMEGRMGSMEGRMESMEGRMGSMEGRMESMEGRMGSMQGQLNNLTGTDYERRMVRRSRNIVQRYLGIRQAQLLQAISIPDNTSIPNLLYDAMGSGVISQEQVNDVDDADLVLFGSSADGSESYVLAEVSITIDDSDIDRAHRRAAALNTASGVPARAVVIGAQISDVNRERADSLNVAVAIVSHQAQE